MKSLLRQLFALVAFCLISHSASAKEGVFRILAIDGGGIRGIISATIIAQIEKDLGKPIAQAFDMVAGTSIGGIVALALTAPNSDGAPKYSAEAVLNIAFSKAERIFSAPFRRELETLGGLNGPKYDANSLANVIFETLGNAKMSEAIVPTLVTGYQVECQAGIEFFSEDAKAYPGEKDCLMHEVALATASAPTYFEITEVHFPWGTLSSVVDGALYKNNPALLAYANAKRLYPDHIIEVYSIGAGIINAEEKDAALRGRGKLQWMSSIFRHMSIGNVDADVTVLHKLMNENHDATENFFRLNISIDDTHQSMDDTSMENLKYLHQKGLEATEMPTYQRMITKLRA